MTEVKVVNTPRSDGDVERSKYLICFLFRSKKGNQLRGNMNGIGSLLTEIPFCSISFSEDTVDLL